jgi:hypothetical protein
MSIEKILAISGKPGLYELKLQTRTGFLAESLTDGKKVSVGLRSNVSLLSEISVYTYDGETRLSEVFVNIAKKRMMVLLYLTKRITRLFLTISVPCCRSLMKTVYMCLTLKRFLTGTTCCKPKDLFLLLKSQ